MAKIEQLDLTVQDRAIHCEGCESRIQTVVGRLQGVVKVRADHKTQLVTLTLDTEQTPLDEVRQKLEFAGFRTE